MNYYLEYDKEKKVIGWLTSEFPVHQSNLTQVRYQLFKSELAKIGVDFKNEVDKLKDEKHLLENALLEIASLQSKEYEDRIKLEEAILELASLISEKVV